MNIFQRAYPWYWEQHGGELKRFAFGVSAAAVTSAALPGIGSWGRGNWGEDASVVVSVVDSDCDWLAQLSTWLSLGLTEKAMDFNYKQLFALFFIYLLFYSFFCMRETKTKDFFIEGTYRVCNKKKIKKQMCVFTFKEIPINSTKNFVKSC